jgi:hypothetical protein
MSELKLAEVAKVLDELKELEPEIQEIFALVKLTDGNYVRYCTNIDNTLEVIGQCEIAKFDLLRQSIS